MKVTLESNIDEVVKKLMDELNVYQSNMKFTMFKALSLLEAEVMQNIRTKSGLKVRTGTLLNSIPASKRVTEDGLNVLGSIGPEGVPYAAIHEFGGKTNPHKIEPRTGKVLAFNVRGSQAFAKFVNHPGSNIPARPYLFPAYETKKEEILKTFGLFIAASFKTR